MIQRDRLRFLEPSWWDLLHLRLRSKRATSCNPFKLMDGRTRVLESHAAQDSFTHNFTGNLCSGYKHFDLVEAAYTFQASTEVLFGTLEHCAGHV